jgi:hypothetical protein
MTDNRRVKLVAYGALAAIVIVLVAALALGGHGASSSETSSAGPGVASPPRTTAVGGAGGEGASTPVYGQTQNAPVAAPSAAAGRAPSASGANEADVSAEDAADAVTATRVVKTGSLQLLVNRGQVQATISKLITLTGSLGGYVAQSNTDTVAGSPTGALTIRMPVARFDSAVNGAERLGHVVSLSTNAHDVTGQVVDLGARVSALRRTRATYLTILGRATTIGATLEVQQRVDDVQQQIEEIQGELKVLHNQSADGTLAVSVSQRGTVVHVARHHKRTGIGLAWHNSISRFARGFDAIVGALGPLLLAILVLAVLAGIARLGYRGVRRATP